MMVPIKMNGYMPPAYRQRAVVMGNIERYGVVDLGEGVRAMSKFGAPEIFNI
jgi:hypothetical protein